MLYRFDLNVLYALYTCFMCVYIKFLLVLFPSNNLPETFPKASPDSPKHDPNISQIPVQQSSKHVPQALPKPPRNIPTASQKPPKTLPIFQVFVLMELC